MDRRQFLTRTAFFTVAAASLAACGGGDDGPTGRYTFPQGVASGDPKSTSLVFWSRCVRSGADGADMIPVTLQVSASPAGPQVGDDVTLAEIESEHIRLVVARAPSLDAAAATLGIDVSTLWRKRKRQSD